MFTTKDRIYKLIKSNCKVTTNQIYKLIKSNCKVTTNQNTEYNRANISNGRDSICLVCPIDSILFVILSNINVFK